MVSSPCRTAFFLVLLLASSGCLHPPGGSLSNDELRMYFQGAQDPRAHWLTVYESDDGSFITGGFRLHPQQSSSQHFLSGMAGRVPAITVQTHLPKRYRALIDTSSAACWISFEKALNMGLIPLGPPAYGAKPLHTRDDSMGYASVAGKLRFDQLHVERALIYMLDAKGPLKATGRDLKRWKTPDVVLGYDFLEAFRYVQINYPDRTLELSIDFGYRPSDALLVAEAPLLEVEGALGTECIIDGKPGTILIDSVGDYAVALPGSEARPIRQISIGDLVQRNVSAVSAREQGLGDLPVPRVGTEILSKFKVTFDMKERRIYFERPPQKRFIFF